jgi:hypothetical protein
MSNDRVKVLFLAADPFQNGAPLQLDREMRAVYHATQHWTPSHTLEFVADFATRTRDLQAVLLRHQPQIVHFTAHGGQSGAIWLQDEHGTPRAADEHALGSLFRALAGTTRVVVLNGCATGPVVEALGDMVDYVVGLSPMTDDSAIAFAAAFYTSLSFNGSVGTAFELAVAQLRLTFPSEAAGSILRIRPGVAPDEGLMVEGSAERSPNERGERRLRSGIEGLNASLTGDENQKGYRPRPKPKPNSGNG